VPAAGPRGSARGRALTSADAFAAFRCSVASEDRSDYPAGTAPHLRALLLIEHHGPWGLSAPRDSRLPDAVKQHLSGNRGVKVLLARRHHRAHRGATFQALLCVPARRLLLRTTFTDPAELVDLDLEAVGRGELPSGTQGALHWEEVSGPVYGICTHGRHDACCAERGRPVCQALTAARPEETWEISHVGGDRFAPNMVVLPEGLYYGRLSPESVTDVAALHEEGRLDLDRLRGRATYPMPAQYAEIALLRHLGEDRLDALRLVHREDNTCEFSHGEDRWRVVVSKTMGETAKMTCSAAKLGRAAVFEAETIEQV
jgi:hypothetical protein